jgi:hypothetical protein
MFGVELLWRILEHDLIQLTNENQYHAAQLNSMSFSTSIDFYGL